MSHGRLGGGPDDVLGEMIIHFILSWPLSVFWLMTIFQLSLRQSAIFGFVIAVILSATALSLLLITYSAIIGVILAALWFIQWVLTL